MALTRATEREDTVALHEAGHAVVARLLGHRVMRASIEPGDDYDGRVQLATRPGDEAEIREQDAWEHIIITLAGDLAAREVGKRDTELHDVGLRKSPASDELALIPGGDADAIWSLALSQCGDEDEMNALVAWLTARTRNLVRLHGQTIREVANELLACQTLSQSKVDRILRDRGWTPGRRGQHFKR